MTHELNGQLVLIAGASSGMGYATALAAARAGAELVLVARNLTALKRLQARIIDSGGRAHAIPCDLTDRHMLDQVLEKASTFQGHIDVAVNSVGTNIKQRSLDELSMLSWEHMISTNLTAAFNLTQAIVPLFRKQGYGLLIHISSIAARKADRSGVAYQAAKAGVAALAQATMEEERAMGIRVSVVYPGLTDTPLVLQRPTPTPPDVLARALQPEDIAAACLFIMQLPKRAYVPELVISPREL